MGFGSTYGGASRPGIMRMDVRGVKDLQRALMGLKAALQRRVMRGAMSKASRVLVKEVKQKVVVETGTLKRSIGFKLFTGKSGADAGTVMSKIGPRRGMARKVALTKKGKLRAFSEKAAAKAGLDRAKMETRNPTRYAHLVELGTAHSPPKSFLRTAIDGSRDMVLGVLRAQIRIGIEREARKLAAKSRK